MIVVIKTEISESQQQQNLKSIVNNTGIESNFMKHVYVSKKRNSNRRIEEVCFNNSDRIMSKLYMISENQHSLKHEKDQLQREKENE